MSKKIHIESDEILCSNCGETVSEEEEVCDNCGSELEQGVVQGKRCPDCNMAVENGIEVCPNCGGDLSSSANMDEIDDDFLINILGWGDETKDKLKERIEEKKRAIEIFKKLADSSEDEEIKINTEKYDDLSLNFDEIRHPVEQLIEDINTRREETKVQIGELEEKLSEIEEKTETTKIEKELDYLKNKEEEYKELINNLSKMKDSIKDAFQEEKGKIEARCKELERRINDFKEMYEGKGKEEKEIKEKKENLIQKEKELEKWEDKLEKWNKNLKEKEKTLVDEKEMYEEGEKKLEEIEKNLSSKDELSKEEWLSEQKKIQRELFNLKDMWGERGENIDFSDGSIPKLKRKIKKKEKEWEGKVEDLENELEEVRKEKEKLEEKDIAVDVEIEEIKKILKILDQLLGELPEEKINEFAKSENFDLYEKVLDAFDI